MNNSASADREDWHKKDFVQSVKLKTIQWENIISQ